jgi:2-oxoglutarate dehydrogenase E2 component (dihydrolipoamide succinyltransferase)
MLIEVKVPSPGESISEVQLAGWLVEDGAYVDQNQDIAEIDSDKATLSIAAEVSGIISLKANAGDTIAVGSVIATINASESAEGKAAVATNEMPATKTGQAVTAEKAVEKVSKRPDTENTKEVGAIDLTLSPLARKLMEAGNITDEELITFFSHYRITRKDLEFYQTQKSTSIPDISPRQEPTKPVATSRNEDRKKMSTLRKKLSERLVSVKNETAMLTTFNEVNMSAIMDIRNKYKDSFKQKYGVGLGFMSFFTKAVTEALKLFPQVNSQIDGDDIVTYNYADISIAVSGPKGLVVPVIRNAGLLSLAEIEIAVKELAIKARDNKLSLDDMSGGTFTITNGGVFGSMLSTPIINPPQSAILGMHNIVDRPIAVNGKVEIHPIMYVALSYDHRIIDGRESVGFLVKVKEMLENPASMLFGAKNPVETLLGI